MNISEGIIYLIKHGPHKTFREVANELGDVIHSTHEVKTDTIRRTLQRLKRQDIIADTGGELKLTQQGYKRAENLENEEFFISFINKHDGINDKRKEVLIMFDIPERERVKRNWLRQQLVGFGYEPIQQSVWFGPKLKNEFVTHLIKHSMHTYIRIFHASEEYIENSKLTNNKYH